MKEIELPENIVISEWDFTIERDSNHLMKGIKAKAVIDG